MLALELTLQYVAVEYAPDRHLYEEGEEVRRKRLQLAGSCSSPASRAAVRDLRGRGLKLSAAGRIPHRKHEGRLLFRREELDAWLDAYRRDRR